MILLHVKIKPGASKNEITIDPKGNWFIKIKERPINGAANIFLIQFLSKEFNIRKSCITIEKGLNSPFKKLKLNIDSIAFEKLIRNYQK